MTTTERRQLWFWVVAAALAVLLLLLIARWRERAIEGERIASFLTGDAANGAWLYQVKGCASCHPLDAPPQHGAPDLRKVPEGHASFNALVSAMWNHAPAMWQRMAEARVKYPNLRTQEVADLFAFLYVIRYVDEPGSAERGQELFASKGCAECHVAQETKPTEGPDLRAVDNVDVPIVWVQKMWNHALPMQEHMQRHAMPWPRFQDAEMSDLLAYMRTISSPLRKPYELFPADVRRGRRLFHEKACGQCHAINGEGGGLAPDLGRLPRMPRTLGQMAATMWNHWPQMAEWMKQRKVRVPMFEGKDMADLLAYLYALRYFDEPGHAHSGREIYASKNCERCHGVDGRGSEHGPNLRRQSATFSSVYLASAMWRHGPRMYTKMQGQGISWPKFQGSEMNDLVAYLNTW